MHRPVLTPQTSILPLHFTCLLLVGNIVGVSWRHHVGQVMQHFRLQEVKDEVIPSFGVTWKYVKKKIVRGKLPMNLLTIKRILLEITEDWEESEVEHIVYDLTISDVALHSERKIWHSFEMVGEGHNAETQLRVGEEVKKIFRRKSPDSVVRTKMFDDIVWIMIAMHVRSQRSNTTSWKSIFGAYFMGERYLFLTGNIGQSNILSYIIKGLGFKRAQRCDLTGYHVKSLFEMMKTKESRALNSHHVGDDQLHYTEATPRMNPKGVDFTHSEDKDVYVDRCFGTNPPVLSQLRLKSKESWQGVNAVPQMAGKKFECTVTFQSTNVLKMLKEMVKVGAVTPPFPSFIQDIPIVAKNTVVLNEEDPGA